jgi:hypothetical protein
VHDLTIGWGDRGRCTFVEPMRGSMIRINCLRFGRRIPASRNLIVWRSCQSIWIAFLTQKPHG